MVDRNIYNSGRPKVNGQIFRTAVTAALVLVLAGCVSNSGANGGWGAASRSADLTPAQSCAIGKDLSEHVYKHAAVRGTEIIPPKKANSCEEFMTGFLRRAGYALNENARGEAMDVEIDRLSADRVFVYAKVTGGFQVAREYELLRGGVKPLTAASTIISSSQAGN
jgi:hypothetical protein